MKKNISPKELGNSFENRVRNAFEKNSYVLIKQNQWKKNYKPEQDRAGKREYDLVMFSLSDRQFYIIECKAHYSQHKLVNLRLVKEFHHKLSNYNGRSARRMLVTDTDFTCAAKRYAQKNNIQVMNGRGLGNMEENSEGVLMPLAARMISSGLEILIDKLAKNYLE